MDCLYLLLSPLGIGIGAILAQIPVPTLPLSTEGCDIQTVNENLTTITNLMSTSTEQIPPTRLLLLHYFSFEFKTLKLC